MTLDIFFSIITITGLFIIIKKFTDWKVVAVQSLIVNYIVASLFAFVADYQLNITNINKVGYCLQGAVPMGFLFILSFYVASLVAHYHGITITSVVGKMGSLIITVVGGVLLYSEQLSLYVITGVILAMASVLLANHKATEDEIIITKKKGPVKVFLLLAFYFTGSGAVDSSIKFMQAKLITPETKSLYIVMVFLMAGMWGVLYIVYDYFKTRKGISMRSILAGILLGSVNYFSLVFVVRALASTGAKSAVVFSTINIGVLLLSTLSGAVLFKERFSSINYIGIGLALIAIWLLSL